MNASSKAVVKEQTNRLDPPTHYYLLPHLLAPEKSTCNMVIGQAEAKK